MIELRKRKTIEDAMETGAEQPSLYTVLPEKRATVGGAMMGSAHVYDINATVSTSYSLFCSWYLGRLCYFERCNGAFVVCFSV